MMTAEDRAALFCDFIFSTSTGRNRDIMEHRIALLLKEQDRCTRHACSDAVIALHSEDFEGVCVIGRDAAHNACMNVKAV